MKDSDVPEISSSWWKKHQPTTLSSTGLGEALRTYEAARKSAQPTQSVKEVAERLKAYDEAFEKLDSLTPAVAKAQAKCNKTLHATCLKVLTKYPAVLIKEKDLLKREREALTKLVTDQIESSKVAGAKILGKIIEDVKVLEKQLTALEAIVDEAEDAEADVARAVADNEPNAGDLEVTVLEGHLRDAGKLAKELISFADKAEKTALNDWKRDFDSSLKGQDKQLQLLADKCDVQFENFEMARKKAESSLREVEESAKSVRKMADGQGDLEGQFLKTCLGLESRTQKLLGLVRSAFAEAGGSFDRARFNAMNFVDREHAAFGQREVLDEAKIALQRGIAALNKGKVELGKGRTGFDRTIMGLPDFAVKSNPKFREVLEALEKAAAIYEDYGQQAGKLAVDANKAAETYKKAL